jgi:hydroxysqualene synthase
MIRRVVASRENPAPLSPPTSGPWTVEQAFAYCERIAREHSENFPVASRFVPAHLRPYVWAIYAFARTADDFADEPRWADSRRERLDDWEDKLEAAYHGEADHPVFVALRETIERRDIPISPLRDLLTAFRMDLSVSRHSTWESLRGYCSYSSHPVGQLVLYVFDYRDPSLHRYSDDLCAALQLTHILQDVPRDLGRGRIYLPEEDLAHFGVSESDLAAGRVTPGFKECMRFEVARARALLERGRPIADRVGRDLGFELNLIWLGGSILLDKIEAVGYDVFRRRPSLTGADKVRMAASSALRRWPSFAHRP